MRIAIIAAMEEEIKFLKEHIEQHEIYEFQGYEYHIGIIHNQRIVVVQSGIGKVNAALSTALLLEHFKVKKVINTGSAGGIRDGLNIGDIIVAEKTIYHDVDVTAFGYTYGQIPKMPQFYLSDQELVDRFMRISHEFQYPTVKGTIATGDQFMSDTTKLMNLKKYLGDIEAVDMEAAAITQVCYQYRIPFVIVRSISDLVQDSSNIDFNEFIHLAAKCSTDIIIKYLNDLENNN